MECNTSSDRLESAVGESELDFNAEFVLNGNEALDEPTDFTRFGLLVYLENDGYYMLKKNYLDNFIQHTKRIHLSVVNLKEEIQEHKNDNKVLVTAVDSFVKQIDVIQKENKAMKSQLQLVEGQKKELIDRNNLLVDELSLMQTRSEEYKSLASSINVELGLWKKKYSNQKKEHQSKDQSKLINKLENDKLQLKKSINSYENDIQKLKEEKRAMTRRACKIESDLEYTTSLAKRLTDELNQINQKYPVDYEHRVTKKQSQNYSEVNKNSQRQLKRLCEQLVKNHKVI